MNSFLKTFFASLLAIIVSVGAIFFLFFVFFAVSLGSVMKTETSSGTVRPNTILKMDFSVPIVESLSDNPVNYFDIMAMEFRPNSTSYDVIKSIRIATTDPQITAIYLDMTSEPMVDLANMEDIRNALLEFKNSGKKIYSYADVYTQKSYYLSSVADSIYLCPVGELQWMGLGSVNMFFKGALDKVGVNVEVFKYGKYKSAVEPFLLSGMSDENRLQSQRMLDNIWGRYVTAISESRNIDAAKLQEYASSLAVGSAADALKLGFVDRLAYGSDITTDGHIMSFSKYVENNHFNELIAGAGSNKNQVAVIYADGQIVSGKSDMGVIGDKSLVKRINSAADDANVKAIVLRVNSPGGSALASDVIDRAVRNAKMKKPVVVSMGSMAASGGYYISSNADAIVASPYTLTGSIGVFGLTFNAGETVTKYTGVTFDAVKTNAHADMGSPYRRMTDVERAHFQSGVNRVYENFVNCVSNGRDMSFAAVDSIAQGRVWTTDDAVENGLV
ncbi:MAG: signal peptide peptidase SppA, partial [Rikenellaceae bacterium]